MLQCSVDFVRIGFGVDSQSAEVEEVVDRSCSVVGFVEQIEAAPVVAA